MTTPIFFAVLLAAFLHAGWNVLVKSNADRLVSLTVLQGFMALVGVAMILGWGLPGWHVWPFAVTSAALHLGYNLFLVRAYRQADLSVVYPVARGAAPLLTLIASLLFAVDAIDGWTVLAVVTLVAGLMMTGLGGKAAVTDRYALLYALGTAAWIAAYTLVDGLGARASGDVMSFAGLIFMLDGVCIVVVASALRGRAIWRGFQENWLTGAAGGMASAVAYGIAVWAMTVAPIASVAALRETSIVFVLILSARVLKERLSWQRIGGGCLIVIGAMLMRLT
jgi:drug/metabolite transporter (DMT)-like permease